MGDRAEKLFAEALTLPEGERRAFALRLVDLDPASKYQRIGRP